MSVIEELANSSDEEPPELTEQTSDTEEATPTEGKSQNRSEKKSRKAMLKLGMRPATGINRVTLKKNKNVLFVISQCDCFKSPTSDTYVIFGEAKIEDLSQQAAQQQAQQMRQTQAAAPRNAPVAVDSASMVGGEDAAVDETGVEAKDIELVMSQAGTTRAKAVVALRNNDSDIVNAIMELTM